MAGNIRRLFKGLAAGVLLMAGTTGCETMSNTAKGGLIGGGVGTGVGAAIGSASGKTGQGALIGGLAGAALGGLVGNDVDSQEKKAEKAKLEAAQYSAARPPLSIDDVRQLAAGGTSDDIIVNQIRTTGSTYNLGAGDIQYLTQNGVSNRVITEMQNSRNRPAPPPRIIRETTVIRQQPEVIYVPQAPPPPVMVIPGPPQPSFGVGVNYTRVR
jgi:surface antigen